VASPCDPQHAPAGDVGAALMMIDSRLKALHDDRTGVDAEQRALIDQFTASLGPGGADAVVDGTCTLIYMFVQWLRMAYEDHDEDPVEHVLPNLVGTLRMMPASIPPETIPTMAGLVVAAGTGLSPSLWRRRYGDWAEEEMRPLEATAFLLAEHINRLTGDPEFATRMIAEALTRADGA
jgi:hypothetical protein